MPCPAAKQEGYQVVVSTNKRKSVKMTRDDSLMLDFTLKD